MISPKVVSVTGGGGVRDGLSTVRQKGWLDWMWDLGPMIMRLVTVELR